jgi:hypothetical protein
LLEDLADELDDARRIALPGVIPPSRLTLARIGVEDLRANGRRSDVEREDPRHDPTITSGGGYAGNHDDREDDGEGRSASDLALERFFRKSADSVFRPALRHPQSDVCKVPFCREAASL